MAKGSSNPRYGKRFSARDRLRKRVASEGRPCALCGKPIDYSLDWWEDPKDGKRKRHPLSYELDEIVPISRGGSPFDYDNVQPAHRICNQRRGNRLMKREDGTVSIEPIDAPITTSRAW